MSATAYGWFFLVTSSSELELLDELLLSCLFDDFFSGIVYGNFLPAFSTHSFALRRAVRFTFSKETSFKQASTVLRHDSCSSFVE